MDKYINSNLLILIPLTMCIGFILKNLYNNSYDIRKILRSTNGIKITLYIMDIVLASIIGLAISNYTGWRLFIDGIVRLGLCHGGVCCFMATKLYDKAREM